MTENKAPVKDHVKETEKAKDKGPDHLVHQNTGADALKVIKKHDEAKKADGLEIGRAHV